MSDHVYSYLKKVLECLKKLLVYSMTVSRNTMSQLPLHEGDVDKEVKDQRFLQLILLPSLFVE